MEDNVKLIVRQIKKSTNETLKSILTLRQITPMDKVLKDIENKLIRQIELMENVERDNTVSNK